MPTSVVTGAASGIGAAVCKQLQAAGHRVIGVDRSQADVVADLSNRAGRQAAIEALLDKTGGVIDQLILCAGLGASTGDSGLIVAVNYFGVSELLDGLFDALQQGKAPAAVVIGSIASVLPGGDHPQLSERLLAGDEAAAVAVANEIDDSMVAYGTSKYAVTVMARNKVLQWGQAGVRLNVVAPGAVATPLLQASKDDPKYGEATKKFVAPLGRDCRADELADVICYLTSDRASCMHGTVIFADGGMDGMVRPTRF